MAGVAVVVVMVFFSVVMMMRMRNPWILAKDQRFDRHRHRERRHADAPEIDVVEIPERDPVERQDF